MSAVAEVFVVPLEELVAQWWGDEDTCGYQHPELVAEACKLDRPASEFFALKIFYPEAVPADIGNAIEQEAVDIIKEGWRRYTARRSTASELESISE